MCIHTILKFTLHPEKYSSSESKANQAQSKNSFCQKFIIEIYCSPRDVMCSRILRCDYTIYKQMKRMEAKEHSFSKRLQRIVIIVI